jgi:hypothetical protein
MKLIQMSASNLNSRIFYKNYRVMHMLYTVQLHYDKVGIKTNMEVKYMMVKGIN